MRNCAPAGGITRIRLDRCGHGHRRAKNLEITHTESAPCSLAEAGGFPVAHLPSHTADIASAQECAIAPSPQNTASAGNAPRAGIGMSPAGSSIDCTMVFAQFGRIYGVTEFLRAAHIRSFSNGRGTGELELYVGIFSGKAYRVVQAAQQVVLFLP